MHAFATALLALLPLAAAGPVVSLRAESAASKDNHKGCGGGKTCSDLSGRDFKWGIVGFDYHASYIFTNPAHQNSWGYVSFNLTNSALPYPAVCSAQSSQLSDFFYGTQIYTCTYPAGSNAPASTVTTFDFSRPSGRLDVNQTWQCHDDPQYPATYNAYGTVNLTLDCTDTTYQNPNWTSGQIYSDREVKCKPVSLPLIPYKMTAIA